MLVEYKFFQVAPGGLIDAAARVRLSDDDAALTHARAVADNRVVEVWRGERRLFVVPPKGRMN